MITTLQYPIRQFQIRCDLGGVVMIKRVCPFCGGDISVATWKDYAYMEATGRTYVIVADVCAKEDSDKLAYDISPVIEQVESRGYTASGYKLATLGSNTTFFGDIMPKVGAYCKHCDKALGILR